MEEAVIVSGARTAVGAFAGALKGVKVVDLGALVIGEAIRRAGLRPAVNDLNRSCRPDNGPEETKITGVSGTFDSSLTPAYFDECIMGNVLQAAQGQNPARQASIYSGLPVETNAWTLNMVCASGMKAIALAAGAIWSGTAEAVIAGGMENMTNAPYALNEARFGYRMNMPFGQVTDLMVYDGLYEIFNGYHMGQTAENIAQRYGITRAEQDELALISHQRALAAIRSGLFAEEIIPVPIPQKKGDPIFFQVDERPMETSLEKLARLSGAFIKNGTVTAGNASGINDGAAAVVVMSGSRARELGLNPLARIKGFAMGGVDPAYMGLGPIPATRKLFKKLNITMADIDLVELNEAFACQALACIRELKVDPAFCNVNGSGISLGHPIGATGARITYGLAMEMQRRDVNLGLAALCIGGGQGMALVLER
ncbi:MAG: acetyl-CoA C-acetyltransferase [Smithellaceae bacterium]|nr:acetyl-CoA C-acetyltransferase [Smithellaceae bacterium]